MPGQPRAEPPTEPTAGSGPRTLRAERSDPGALDGPESPEGGWRLPAGYAARELLGKGGMGVVVGAVELATGRDVAIKLVLPSQGESARTRERFARETEALLRLRHPAIVRVERVFADELALVMERVQGETLRARMAREGKLPPGEIRQIALALLGALGAAHRAHVVHRDVKPSNVILRGPTDPVLVDFGVVALTDAAITGPGASLGTPSYMPPEQLRGQRVDARADLYSLAATLYEAATGKRLHAAAPGTEHPEGEVLRHTGDRPLASAIARALRDQPFERFESAAHFARALDGQGTSRRSPKLAFWLGGVTTLVAAATTALLLFAPTDGGPGPMVAPPAPSPSAPASPPSLPRLGDVPAEGPLAEAERALSSHHFQEAERALTEALRTQPTAPQALYDHAVVAWWLELPEKETMARIARAEAAELRPEQRAFLDGLGDLVAGDNLRAAARFEALVARYPHDRDVLYGLFEARYHAGNATLAWAAYRELVGASPDFRLGLMHVFDYASSRGDREKLDFVLARPGVTTEPIYAPWLVRYHVALRDYEAASAELVRLDERADPALDRAILERDRVAVWAYSGRLAEALRRAQRLAQDDPTSFDLPLASLHRAAGHSREEAPHLGRLRAQLDRAPSGSSRTSTRLLLLMHQLPDGRPEEVRLLARGLAEDLKKQGAPGASGAVLSAVAAGLGEDTTTLSELARSPYPEAGALARAFEAEHAGRLGEALGELEAAIATSPDGRVTPIERQLLAEWARRAGATDRLVQACDALVRPTQITWSWGSAVRPCLTWLAEAAESRGDTRAVRDAKEALARLAVGP